MQRLPIWILATAVICCSAASANAQESAFHEVETKYIFGSFTVGSSIDAEGEKAFEPETQADFGKRAGRYAATETELEYEFTPTQYLQIELGPTVSYYNIKNVPGLDDQLTGSRRL
jgi:hypothetical protein